VVSASRVAGSADLTFLDGSTFKGSFDVPGCAFQGDLCGAFLDTCVSGACIP
jgi:hypothetical protein